MTARDDMLLCQVFRSERRAGTYLYTEQGSGCSRVPESLMAIFGEPHPVLTLRLHPGRRLAQADATEVLRAIREQGFYLQMPPLPGSEPGEQGTQGVVDAD